MSVFALSYFCTKKILENGIDHIGDLRDQIDLPYHQTLFNLALHRIKEIGEDSGLHLFNIKNADFLSSKMTEPMVRIISNLENLESLKVVCNLMDYEYNCGRGASFFNVPSLLNDCLNEKSRKTLTRLTIEDDIDGHSFARTDLTDALDLLPNLEEYVSMQTACPNFRTIKRRECFKLLYLDISHCYPADLYGISNLPHLETLIMHNVYFKDSASVKDIFLLKKLKTLDVSQDTSWRVREKSHILSLLVELNESFSALTDIDLANTIFTEEQLQEFLKLNPSIQKICLLGTECSETVLLGKEVRTGANLESAIKLLNHYKTLGKCFMVQDVLKHCRELLRQEPDYETNEKILTTFLSTLIDLMNEFSSYGERTVGMCVIEEVILGIECLDLYTEHYIENVSHQMRRHIARCLLNGTGHNESGFWEVMEKIGITSFPEMNKDRLLELTYRSYAQPIFKYQFSILQILRSLVNAVSKETLIRSPHFYDTQKRLIQTYWYGCRELHDNEGKPLFLDLIWNIVKRGVIKVGVTCNSHAMEVLAMLKSSVEENYFARSQMRMLEFLFRFSEVENLELNFSREHVEMFLKYIFKCSPTTTNDDLRDDAEIAFKVVAACVRSRHFQRKYVPCKDEIIWYKDVVKTMESWLPGQEHRFLVPRIIFPGETFHYEPAKNAKEWIKMTSFFLAGYSGICRERRERISGNMPENVKLNIYGEVVSY